MKIAHVINMSGGKDSTATALLAMDRLGEKDKKIFVFADTGHELPQVYEYIDYLSKRMNTQILKVAADFSDKFEKRRETVQEEWTKKGVDPEIVARAVSNLYPTGNQFTDMAMLRAGFPAPAMRFCTEALKIRPIREQIINPLLDEGYHVIQWMGVRKDESYQRSGTRLYRRLPEGKGKKLSNIYLYHPIRDWTEREVFKFIKSKKVKRNPLYDMGLRRVGCAPCIYENKGSLAKIAKLFPEQVEKVAEMERLVTGVSKQNKAAFFDAKGKKYQDRLRHEGIPMNIFEAVEYAKDDSRWHEDQLSFDDKLSLDELYDISWNDPCEGGYCG